MKTTDIYDEFEVGELLMKLGAHPGYKGYRYTIQALELVRKDSFLLTDLRKKLMPAVSSLAGGNAESVERCIRNLKDVVVTPNTGDKELKIKVFGKDYADMTTRKFLACIYEYLRIKKRVSIFDT